MPRVSVLIVSYNTRALLLEALASVTSCGALETIVVDNASTDGSADAVAEQFPDVRLVRSVRNLGFAAGVNLAASHARGEALLVLNPDARLTAGALSQMATTLDRQPQAAMVGPSLRYADGAPQPAAFMFPGLFQVALDLFPIARLMDTRWNGRVSSDVPCEIDHPLGACMLIRRAAWTDVGPLDEAYFMYLEEVDWCRRAKDRDWQVWYEPRAVVVHHAGQSTRQAPDAMFAQLWRSRLRYYQRFSGPTFNRLVHSCVRSGLARAAHNAPRARVNVLAPVRRLVH
ncbi:MAG: glycosyltransferase family 2 protein [Chloroflexota bacterium]